MRQNEVSQQALPDLTIFIATGMISDFQTVSGPNIIGHLKIMLCAVHPESETHSQDFFTKLHALLRLIYGWDGRIPA